MPLLKTAAVAGTAAIPGAGPILAPIVGGALTAGQSAISGQGPLSSLSQGVISGGMQAGMGALGDTFQGPAEGVANTSQFAGQYSLGDPNMMSGLPNDALTRFAHSDLLKKWNGGF